MATDPKTLKYRKEHNLCPRDGRPNKSDKKMCEFCLAKAAVRAERYRQKKIIAGLCTGCGSKAHVSDSRLCADCKRNTAVACRGSHIKRYNDRKLMNKCTMCGDKAVGGKVACQKCLEKQSSLKKNRYGENASKGLCIQCGKNPPAGNGKRCQTCIDKRNIWYQGSTTQAKDKVRRDENREAALKHYGGECFCCREDEICFLAIDHIDGDGNTHRRKINKHGSGFFKWLVDHNFPEGFQVLCHNCNMGRHLNGGICPHREEQDRMFPDMRTVPYDFDNSEPHG